MFKKVLYHLGLTLQAESPRLPFNWPWVIDGQVHPFLCPWTDNRQKFKVYPPPNFVCYFAKGTLTT